MEMRHSIAILLALSTLCFAQNKGYGASYSPKGMNNYPPPQAPSNRLAATCRDTTQENSITISECQNFPSDEQLLNIENLAVTGITIGDLTVQAYISSSKLRKLSLQSCGITDIQESIFITTPGIDNLDLSLNQLTTIRKNTFARLSVLVSLNLYGNGIVTIDHSAFASLDRLESLILSNNQLAQIPTILPRALKVLILSNNVIQQIDSSVSLKNLEELDLCSNKVEKATSAIYAPSLNKLCIGNAPLVWSTTFLDSSELDSLRDVTLIGLGGYSRFSSELFSFLNPKLIHVLTIKDYDISELAVPATLKELSLIHVKVDSSINVNPLIPCGKHLTSLDLTGSHTLSQAITSNQDVINSLTNLKTLTLKGCDVRQLHWIKIEHPRVVLPMLTVCDISDNSIDCSDYHTMHVLCESHKKSYETTIDFLGMDTVTCSATKERWSYALCDSIKRSDRPNIPPPVDGSHPAHDRHGGHEQYEGHEYGGHQSDWRIWYIVIGVLGGIVLLLGVALIVWCCVSKRHKEELRQSSEIWKNEKVPMIDKK